MMIKRPHGDAVFFDYKKLFFSKCSTRSISKSRRDYGQMEVLGMFVCNQAEIPLKFTDKVPFLADLSVSKTHFTDKPAISSDLSVNFWPL